MPLVIVIYLVGGDVYDGAHAFDATNALKQIDGTDHIRLVGERRVVVPLEHERLSGKMKHDLRLILIEDLFEDGEIANVAACGVNQLA